MPGRSNGLPPGRPDVAHVRFVAVTPSTRAAFEGLFEQPGAPKYCWCMAWRPLANRKQARNDEKKRSMMARIDAGTPVGIVAEAEGRPVGWCSAAPRDTYRKLTPSQYDGEQGIWSIVCFYVPRAWRGLGLAMALLDAAVDHAFSKGARVIEAYPVEKASPSYRFMGFQDMFAARGFVETGVAGANRLVMRLAVDNRAR